MEAFGIGDLLDFDLGASSVEWQLARAQEIGFCERPIFLIGRDEAGTSRRVVAVRCKARQVAKCVPCSLAYQLDARRLIRLGFAPERRTLRNVRWWWLTLTAPGIELTGSPVHTARRAGLHLRPCSPRPCFVCNEPIVCRVCHDPSDPSVGTPIDGHHACYRYWAAVRWNHNVPRLWDKTLAKLRASLIGYPWTLQYAKVVQWQARGAAHIHAILRTTATAAEIRAAVAAARVDRWGWGPQMHLEGLAAAGAETAPRAANAISSRIDYLCRYATRDVRVILPPTPGTARALHIHRLREQAHEMALALDLRDPVRIADGLGYGGRVLTHSRSWGASFASLARARRAFVADRAQEAASGVPLVWTVAQRGWEPSSVAAKLTKEMFAREKPVAFSAFGDLPPFRQVVPGDDAYQEHEDGRRESDAAGRPIPISEIGIPL